MPLGQDFLQCYLANQLSLVCATSKNVYNATGYFTVVTLYISKEDFFIILLEPRLAKLEERPKGKFLLREKAYIFRLNS